MKNIEAVKFDDGIGPLSVEVVDHYEMPAYDVYVVEWLDEEEDPHDSLLICYKEIGVWVRSDGKVVEVTMKEEN